APVAPPNAVARGGVAELDRLALRQRDFDEAVLGIVGVLRDAARPLALDDVAIGVVAERFVAGLAEPLGSIVLVGCRLSRSSQRPPVAAAFVAISDGTAGSVVLANELAVDVIGVLGCVARHVLGPDAVAIGVVGVAPADDRPTLCVYVAFPHHPILGVIAHGPLDAIGIGQRDHAALGVVS